MKQALAWTAWIVAWALTPAWAAEGVPFSRNLQQDAEAAKAIQGPVLVAFVGDHCSYCERVLNEFLIPMSRNPDYQGKVVMRRIETSSERSLRDFSGAKSSHSRFASGYDIYLVPTVALFDGKGNLLGKPLVGLTTVDYYGLYLDERIDQAVAKVRAGNAP
jgi:thioredoxin-related protein